MHYRQITLILFLLAVGMMLWSLYIENYGDPITNIMAMNLFPLWQWYTPCTLCRYERITMYPIVVLFLVHYLRKAKDVMKYTIILALIWAGICAYHMLMQRGIAPSPVVCTVWAPCDYPVINYFWWINLPFLWFITNMCLVSGAWYMLGIFSSNKNHDKK